MLQVDETRSQARNRDIARERLVEMIRAGTAVQEDPDRPAFRGNGPDDYVCVSCGNLLAESMDAEYMTKKVRVRCGRCRTVNVAVTGD